MPWKSAASEGSTKINATISKSPGSNSDTSYLSYPNSRLIDPPTYGTATNSPCANLSFRVHQNASLADGGALRAQKDWQCLFGSLPLSFSGNIRSNHNLVSGYIVAYFVEVAFIIDDVIDTAGSLMAVGAPYIADVLTACDVIEKGGDMDRSACSPTTKLMVGIGKSMIDIDSERAKDAFRWIKRTLNTMFSHPSGNSRTRDFDEYLKYKRTNFASHAMFGGMIFGMGLSIPEDQQQTCYELAQPLYLHFALANDCHSWERDLKVASDRGQTFVANAIWILMNKHSMTCDEAKAACCERASQYAAKYEQAVEATKPGDDLCQDAKLLLERLKLVICGSNVRALQRYSYPADRNLNATQVKMAEALWVEKKTMDLEHDKQRFTDDAVKHLEVKTNGAPCNGAVAKEALANGAITKNAFLAAVRDVPSLSTKVLEAPSRYIDSLPGKGIRNHTIMALNAWFNLPPREIAIISRITDLLHGASLMLDDIQDSSQLRRGKPAAHLVFGPMQTINSAGYRFLAALVEVRKLDELQDLYVGQSHDLSWTCNLECPTEEEYLAMVDSKTAGLFRMFARMLDVLSNSPTKPNVTLLTRFMTLLGRLFQIRDDYMNLTSADYAKQKGFCEDLDEGKYSLAVIHALGRCKDTGTSTTSDTKDGLHTAVIQNLLSQRRVSGSMSLDQKRLFLEYLKDGGSLEYVRRAVDALQGELRSMAEQMNMRENESLRVLMEMLRV
ncbi:isoprenoid synthase domain-containing protein [Corynascus novoguineensis]|uniref:Isoprenoid synthase domain-containing protein n=1 Tax=Corynascus novoguineensis TaxID=1126955 RepID=A0AAN7CMS6_9PEZI|nr:isoprenoid synthase domain-containing protein [Corynascus novoguineensis]